jgi:hypothetical protein
MAWVSPNTVTLGMFRTLTLSLFLTLLGPDFGTFAYQGVPHEVRRAKFEPPDGRTILVIGQTNREISDYSREAGTGDPGGYMTYTAMEDLRGLKGPYEGVGCVDAGEVDLPSLVNRYPRSVGQIGISMNGDLDVIKSGKFDDLIRNLGEVIRQTNKPIFLRIGYEFDGPWNHYDPDLYVSAFRRIVSILRGESVNHRAIRPVTNVSFVWHSAAWINPENDPFEDWYPGDKYVDWVAVSWFGWSNPADIHSAEISRARVLSFARLHRKPVMIAESTPKEYFAPANAKSWDGWYARVFDWIAANNVKAFSYINQDWNAQKMWRDPACKTGGDWGDSRVQKGDPSVLHRWQAAVEDPRFLKAGDNLFESIGFNPQPEPEQ